MYQNSQSNEKNSNLRQYSLTNDGDINNINNSRCPDYALNWSHKDNIPYWKPGHDYFLGNGADINDKESLILRKILSEKLERGTLKKKIIFCDLDGVLADFNRGIINKFGVTPEKLNPGLMWGVINKSNSFFDTLSWMPNGRKLWEEIKQYDPIILTGTPRGKTIEEQKRRWCARELGENIHVITCSTKDKPKYCLSNSILIDDRTENLNAWNMKGGEFILYPKGEEFVDEIIERIKNTV